MVQWENLTVSSGPIGATAPDNLAAIAAISPSLDALGSEEWQLVSAVLVPSLTDGAAHRILFFFRRPVEDRTIKT